MKTKKTQKQINKLKVGTFVKCNSSILYIFKTMTKEQYFHSFDGVLVIERHPEKTLSWGDLFIYVHIAKPKKKHIINTIKQVKDTYKYEAMDNLTYIENLDILKNLLKSDIVDRKN